MPEAVLAGQDGSPAIDAMTGMPLTMEELLRRRGILAAKGVVSPLNLGTGLGADTGSSVVDAAIADAAAANGTLTPNGVGNGTLPGATGSPIDTVAAANAPNGGGSDDESILPYILGPAALLAAALAARKLRKGPNGETIDNFTPDPATKINSSLRREPVDAEFTEIDPGSNRRLSPLLDGSNVTNAGEIGAGPKRLSGTAPVTNTANDNTLSSAVAERRLQDYNTRAPVSTRMENAARQANNSRVLPTGTDVITLRDAYSDMSDEEMTLARQIASRNRTDREIGQTRGVGSRRAGSGVPPAPVYDQSSELTEAVKIVRALRANGVNTQALMPLVRRLRP